MIVVVLYLSDGGEKKIYLNLKAMRYCVRFYFPIKYVVEWKEKTDNVFFKIFILMESLDLDYI